MATAQSTKKKAKYYFVPDIYEDLGNKLEKTKVAITAKIRVCLLCNLCQKKAARTRPLDERGLNTREAFKGLCYYYNTATDIERKSWLALREHSHIHMDHRYVKGLRFIFDRPNE